uniref:Uncharacterized protein n=1 Tax=Ciona intestinalis TaxID=7719 RepID=H2Y0Y5_CIOIN
KLHILLERPCYQQHCHRAGIYWKQFAVVEEQLGFDFPDNILPLLHQQETFCTDFPCWGLVLHIYSSKLHLKQSTPLFHKQWLLKENNA